MLLDTAEFIKISKNLERPWKGIVISNDDPLQIGRVKCSILGLFESNDADQLPFIACKNPAGLGGGADSSSFSVPIVGSELSISFPFGDVYAPFYDGYWQHALSHQEVFNADYPNTYGHRDPTGNIYAVNMAKKTANYTHASGSSFGFDAEGNILLKSSRSIKIESADGKTVFDFNMQEGKLISKPKGGTENSGETHKVSATEYTEEVKSKIQRIVGTKDVQIDGSAKTQIGADSGTNIVGNSSSVIGGNKTDLITGETEITYGSGVKESAIIGDMVKELLAGNYVVEIIAGNITLTTKAGEVKLGNEIANLSFDLIGNAVMKSLTSSIEGLISVDVKAPIVKLGMSPIGQVITTVTSPVVDNITGAPAFGVSGVLA